VILVKKKKQKGRSKLYLFILIMTIAFVIAIYYAYAYISSQTVSSTNNLKLFQKLAEIEQRNGLPKDYAYSVPQTLVIKNNTPIAIVIGEVIDVAFWQKLIESTVDIATSQQNIPIYLGTYLYTKISKNDVESIALEILGNRKNESINLITFGSTTCPHCRNLHTFFENNFKDKCMFLWIDK
jgi:hypothetical protein